MASLIKLYVQVVTRHIGERYNVIDVKPYSQVNRHLADLFDIIVLAASTQDFHMEIVPGIMKGKNILVTSQRDGIQGLV